VRRVLDGDPLSAGDPKGPSGQRERVADAGAHNDVARRRAYAAHARQVLGQHPAQRRGAEHVGVLEHAGVGVAQDRPHRGSPARARKQQRIGPAGAQIVARPDRRGRRRRGGHVRRHRGDAVGRAGARLEPTLGAQLRVGLHHHSARDAEIGGKPPRGGQEVTGAQPARADRLAQAGLQALVQRALAEQQRPLARSTIT
jgi:hypothetical protein